MVRSIRKIYPNYFCKISKFPKILKKFQQVAKKASVLRKRKSKLKLDHPTTTTASAASLSTSQINVSNNPAAAESDEVLCYDEEHKSGKPMLMQANILIVKKGGTKNPSLFSNDNVACQVIT